jgi:4'-phosphopantetheinyl transferase
MSEIWVWYLSATEWHAADYLTLVTEDERTRAQRFHFPQDGGRFLASRALVRAAVGRELDVDPATLAFDRRCHHCGNPDHGKPTLWMEDGDDPPLHFSPTRAGTIVAVAIGPAPLGLDAEPFRDKIEEILAGPMFSRRERTWVGRAQPCEVAIRAMELWVAKEAIGKAAGLGLELADQIVVPLGGHGWRRATDGRGESCWLTALEIPGTAASAVATYQAPGMLRVADAAAWGLFSP